MVNKLIVDNLNIALNESTVLPFTYTFSTAGTHNVRIGLDNTEEICAYAFKDCENLTNVKHIPETITMIKRNAFENCTSLKTFNVPESIKYVGPNVFDGCIALSEINFESSNPPKFLTFLQDNVTCYIPDGSKYIKVQEGESLVKDGSVQYYEKNILGGYDAVDFEALDDSAEYYYDNWVNVHDHYNVVEKRFRVKPNQISFIDGDSVPTSYRDINAGESFRIYDYVFSPENTTNKNVYIYTNSNILTISQDGLVESNPNIGGNANARIFISTEPDYYGTYATTSFSVRILANQNVEPETEYTITFKNGDEVISTVSGVTGTAVTTPEAPTKEGYTFDGWSIDGENTVLPVTNIGTENVIYIAIFKEIEPEQENLEGEYEVDNNGDIQIYNPEQENLEGEYEVDNNGDIQIYNE